MPISIGLPRQSLIFCLLLFSVITFNDIFLLAASAPAPAVLPAAIASMAAESLTSPLWLSFVFAAGLTLEQNGFT